MRVSGWQVKSMKCSNDIMLLVVRKMLMSVLNSFVFLGQTLKQGHGLNFKASQSSGMHVLIILNQERKSQS